MKVNDNIEVIINKLPKGYIFTSNDKIINVKSKQAIIKKLNRLVSKGKLNKLSKGRFYKPESTTFGVLAPSQKQIIKDLLVEKEKMVGYLTGYSIYNQLGLSTQVSNTIQIGRNDIRPAFKRGNFKILIVKQKNFITKENIPLLQILDSIKFIKKIPDTTLDIVISRLKNLIEDLSITEVLRLIKLSKKYPPSTRALLGAILDNIGWTDASAKILPTLNPISIYSFSKADKVLSKIEKWNIK